MKRKMFLRVLIVGILAGTTLFMLIQSSHGSQNFIRRTLVFIALGLGYLGLDKLGRDGHRKLRRIIVRCLVLWFAITLVLIGLLTFFKADTYDFIIVDSIYLFSLLYATLFPIALYLNGNQKKSTSQQAGANES